MRYLEFCVYTMTMTQLFVKDAIGGKGGVFSVDTQIYEYVRSGLLL